jgi:indole-3-glycerol phosphate synthase
MSLLEKILKHKAEEVARAKKIIPPALMKKAALSLRPKKFAFSRALNRAAAIAVIAEIKKKSPANGLLCRRFNPARIAGQYARAGACALSVLTDKKYFGGSASFIGRVKNAVSLPVLRKDFIIDEYQVYETRLLGADALLLIASALKKKKMRSFYRIADRLGLDVLFEVHNAAELKKVLALRPVIVGVNNRDLGSFRVDLEVSARLSPKIPNKIIFISESGIRTGADLRLLKALGADAALVGERLMRQRDPGQALKKLLSQA